jgi:transposase, IS5 family
VPRAVTADRGYGQPAVERDLQALGVRIVAIPRQAKISPARKATEHSRSFRKLVKWRTGSEGRISYLKHTYGWNRTRLDGKGAAIWCGHGVFTHNLVKIGAWSANWPPSASRSTISLRHCPPPARPRHHAGGFFRSK